jgi:citrate lyase subunit beta/citryl-CoA lyase
MQPTRTLLFVPTNRENMIRRAHETPADVIVLDLEDGVAPDGKAAGRAAVRAAIESLKAAGKTVHVRINNVDTGMTRDDLIAAVGPGRDAILYPKPQNAAEIRELDVLIREQEYHREGIRPGTVGLIPMIESARALLRCEDIALASTRTIGLAVGGEDYAADLGVARTKEGAEIVHIRNVVVNVCAAYGLLPLDGIYAPLGDEAGLRADASYSRSLGFKGKYVIHPEQVAPVTEVFSPTPAEVETARKIGAACDEAGGLGTGTVRVEGTMVDAPVARRARGLVAYAEAVGIKTP